MGPLTIEPAEGDLAAACACCAGEPGLRGFVYEAQSARAVYLIEPIGAPKFPMVRLGLVVGAWSPGLPASARESLVFVCKPTADGPSIDPAEPTMTSFPELATLGLPISQVDLPDHPAFADFVSMAKEIIGRDLRLEAIRGVPGASAPPRRFFAEST